MSDIDVPVNLSRQLVRHELASRFFEVLREMFPGLPRRVRRHQSRTWMKRFHRDTRRKGIIPTTPQLLAGITAHLQRQKEALKNEA